MLFLWAIFQGATCANLRISSTTHSSRVTNKGHSTKQYKIWKYNFFFPFSLKAIKENGLPRCFEYFFNALLAQILSTFLGLIW